MRHESITPKTNKGHLNFALLNHRLEELQKNTSDDEEIKLQEKEIIKTEDILAETQIVYAKNILQFAQENPIFIKNINMKIAKVVK